MVMGDDSAMTGNNFSREEKIRLDPGWKASVFACARRTKRSVSGEVYDNQYNSVFLLKRDPAPSGRFEMRDTES
jgi:hypothetical protein